MIILFIVIYSIISYIIFNAVLIYMENTDSNGMPMINKIVTSFLIVLFWPLEIIFLIIGLPYVIYRYIIGRK